MAAAEMHVFPHEVKRQDDWLGKGWGVGLKIYNRNIMGQ